MVVVSTLGAARSDQSRRRRRRASSVSDDPGATPLALTRLTVVTPTELGEAADADRWLDEVSGDELATDAQVETALRLINLALAAQRAGSQDPYVHELGVLQAVTIRIGYGVGDELVDGSWSDAREIHPAQARRRRAEVLHPTERVAAVLGGRDEVLVAETLVLRARLDLDQERSREAALQLRVGLEVLLRDLADESAPAVRDDLAALEANRGAVVEAANDALRGDLDEAGIELLTETVTRCERALRRRRAGA